ncbi:RagB/SusD family nutrient uptake outer membrane protein [Pedobacter yulinensis]|uniref:RagB/SusD family nutrient uptake outer membrane protein n=1 Tax=Pedobacter yulinensis TaxID=2126353 RepID=A0A2T3HL42_9SPHI|nr:RagB/SusD family nutrient uptake outer membrane protein [Pedobacter yulinensis]PST83162.1 RagB/SusD family nutrient uptake outer membrane protein [Pedobacter yulinensis]
MKSHIKNLVAGSMMALVTLSACEKALEEEPRSFVAPDLFFKNEAQCLTALNGAHIPLNAIFSSDLIVANEACTDLAFLNSADLDAKFEISPANPGMGQAIWEQSYKGVMYCNAAIEGIKGAPINEDRKKALLAEGITLRALYYYVLTSTFGDVPYYTDDVSTLKTLEEVMQLGRMDAKVTRNTLIQELKEYAPSLPAQRTSSIPGNRISSSMAYTLIAKMSMWNKDFATALTALKEIQKIYGQLAQYPLEDTYFRNKNTPESIFEVQFTWSATGLKKTSTVACFFTPTKQSGKDIYDGVQIPELGSKANPFASITPSAYFVSLYDLNDPRRNIILAYTYNDKWFSRPQTLNGTGKPWMGPKFWCPGMDNISDGNNQKVFRYADVLLMIAECANELGDANTAMSAINEVKARASQDYVLTEYPGKDQFFQEVKDERARELMGEYGRKWDLVRWGIFYNSVKQTTAEEWEVIKANLRPYHEYYPISDREVTRSRGILTNPAYTGF